MQIARKSGILGDRELKEKFPIKDILNERNIKSLTKSRLGPVILCKWEKLINKKVPGDVPKYSDLYSEQQNFITWNFLEAGKREGLNKKEAFCLLYNYFYAPLHLNFETDREGAIAITKVMIDVNTIRRSELFSAMRKYHPKLRSLHSEAKKMGFEGEPLVWKSKFFDLIDRSDKPVYNDLMDIIGVQDCPGCIAHEIYHRKSNNWRDTGNYDLYEGITEWLALQHVSSDLRMAHGEELKNEVELASYISYRIGLSKLQKAYVQGPEETEKAVFEATGLKIKENEKASQILRKMAEKAPQHTRSWRLYLTSFYVRN